MAKITCLSGRRACIVALFPLVRRRGKTFVQTYKEASFGSDTLQVGVSFVGSTCKPAGQAGLQVMALKASSLLNY